MAHQMQRRTAPGTSGKPLSVKVNAFECIKLPIDSVQHHSVDFGGNLSRELRTTIIKYLSATGQLFQGARPVPFSFDGKANMYMLAPSPMPDKVYEVNEDTVKKQPPTPGKPSRMLKIKIEHAAVVPVAALIDLVKGMLSYQDDNQTATAMQALNIVMKMPVIFDKGYPFKGAKFYVPKEDTAEGKLLADMFRPQPVKTVLQGTAELWGGYFASIRPAIGKMILNVNRSSAPLVKPGNLVDILMEFMNARDVNRINPLNPQMPKDVRLKILRFLKGMYVKIKTRNPRDKFTVKNVEKNSAKTYTFDSEFGKINVQDYFKRKHNMTLKYPDLPLLQITKTAFYPMECCEVWPGSNFFKRLSAAQTAEMLKSRFVTLSPFIKRQAITVGLQQLSINSAFHHSWGINVKPDFMEVSARQLASPQLTYRNAKGQPQTVNTNEGAWMTKGLKGFRAGLKVNRWIVVVFAGDHQGRPPHWEGMPLEQVKDAITGFVKGCKEFGITFASDFPTIYHAGNVQDVKQQLINACKKAGYSPQAPPELVVTFSNASQQYDTIKRACDVELGVPSQNLQIGKADGGRYGYWVNSKLRGVNQITSTALPGCNVPTMLVGADVTHPGAGTCMPSIAALVASHDKVGVEYGCEVNVQESALEIIGDLANMLRKRLVNFFKMNKVKPQRLIFWRDGVSEGQFATVAAKEIAVIKEACQTLEKGYNPSLTFIICAKRHHMQLFPISDKDADKSGNAKAGTCVDTEVVHPSFDDFYLLSHAGLLGTSKPTHFTILLDENKLGKDVIQNLTYQTAHLMPRSTRSISIAAPAQYAHLVCDRARKWIGPMEAEADQMTLSGMTDDAKKEALLKLARERPHNVHTNLQANMFYM